MRLPPLPADQWDEAVQRALAPMLPADGPRDANNALATFAHHPALAKAFLRFNVHLLYSSTLPARIRELAILRKESAEIGPGVAAEWLDLDDFSLSRDRFLQAS